MSHLKGKLWINVKLAAVYLKIVPLLLTVICQSAVLRWKVLRVIWIQRAHNILIWMYDIPVRQTVLVKIVVPVEYTSLKKTELFKETEALELRIGANAKDGRGERKILKLLLKFSLEAAAKMGLVLQTW